MFYLGSEVNHTTQEYYFRTGCSTLLQGRESIVYYLLGQRWSVLLVGGGGVCELQILIQWNPSNMDTWGPGEVSCIQWNPSVVDTWGPGEVSCIQWNPSNMDTLGT